MPKADGMGNAARIAIVQAGQAQRIAEPAGLIDT
jgi:hypothetical protein